MSEETEAAQPETAPPAAKLNRKALLIVAGVLVALVLLVALNMN